MLSPGQKIFEYEIIRLVGQGGFSAVFEARDRLLERRVAIKQLQLKKGVEEKSVKRFIQEARIAAALEHPNVVSVYGLRIESQQFFMIMEYLPGGSLHDLLNQTGQLPPERAVELTIGICEGLARLHERDIIHRDIKTENILLTADGLPKVTDFGIAHVPEAAGGLGLTQVGFQPSTLLYSSPEQIRGEDLDARSDVYQVGEMLYQMLTGEHYIDLDELEARITTTQAGQKARYELRLFEALEEAVCEKMPEGLLTLWHEVGTLAGVVEKALAKDREERYNDTQEFSAALRALSFSSTPASAGTGRLLLEDSRAYNKRGLTHASMRNYEQAIYDYSQAIKLDRHFAEAYNNRSASHLMMENYAEAVLDCNWALELAPHFTAAYVNRGIAHTGSRNYEEALADYNQVIDLSPDNVYAYYNRGNTYIWMGHHEEAVSDYRRVISLNPEFLAAYVNLGVVYDKLHGYAQAVEAYSQAIKLNPDYVYAYFNRANAYRALNQYQKAAADYSKVIELNPQHPHAYENRAKIYTALGQHERADQDHARVIVQLPSINPKELSVARSMLMPSTPIEFRASE